MRSVYGQNSTGSRKCCSWSLYANELIELSSRDVVRGYLDRRAARTGEARHREVR